MRSLLAFAALLLAAVVCAQPREIFRGEYNAPTNHADDGKAVLADGMGGCFVAGRVYSPSTVTYDAHVVAVSAGGLRRWVFEERTAGEDEAPSRLALGAERTVVMVSYTRRQNDAGLRVTCLDFAGRVRFETEIPQGSSIVHHDEAALALDTQGNIYVGAGRDRRMFVAKLDRFGTLLWTRDVGTSTDWAETTGIAVASDGSVYTTGVDGALGGGYRTTKLDSNGSLLWTHFQTGQIGNTLGPSFVRLQSNGDAIVCCTPESTFGVPVYRVFKLSPSGNVLWQHDYTTDPSNDCRATAVTLDDSDAIIVTGFRLAIGADTVTVKYDRDGTRLWEANYTPAFAVANDVVVDAFGRITITGFVQGGSASGLVVGYGPNGNQVWAQNQGPEVYSSLSADARGNVFVCGTVFRQASNDDFVYAKYAWLGTLNVRP